MQRFNTFNMIHKTLRHLMYDTALTLQQTWFADVAEAAVAIEKVEHVIHAFERHASHEDKHILPAVAQYDALLVQAFEADHAKDHRLGNILKNLVNIYRYCDFEEERIYSGSAIVKAYIDFMIFNLEHMGKEEILINAVLWKHYTDEELVQLNQLVVAEVPSTEMLETSKWMIKSIHSREAINWLKQIKATAPAYVLEAVLEEAAQTMPAKRYKKLQEAVYAKAMVA